MEEKIEEIIRKYYGQEHKVSDLRLLSWSPEAEVICIRWKSEAGVVTVKAIFDREGLQITELK
jgi:hypothetical protein